jgi:hypothetical protein
MLKFFESLKSTIYRLFDNPFSVQLVMNYGITDEEFEKQFDVIDHYINNIPHEIKNVINRIPDNDGAVSLFLDCRLNCQRNSMKYHSLIHRYFMDERIQTKDKNGVSFLDFLKSVRPYMNRRPSYKKTFGYCLIHRNSLPLSAIQGVYTIFFTSMCGFKISTAIDFYKQFNPSHIIDPCAGWGGRLIGAMALDIDYTGFDINSHLTDNYKQVTDELGDYSTSNVSIRFEDCLTADINGIDYDMVFTSPPFFNIEIYRDSVKKSKDDWLSFYNALFSKFWNGLKSGGIFAINVNDEIYQKTLVPLLGECHTTFNHKIAIRGKNQTYKNTEMIYVWKKAFKEITPKENKEANYG